MSTEYMENVRSVLIHNQTGALELMTAEENPFGFERGKRIMDEVINRLVADFGKSTYTLARTIPLKKPHGRMFFVQADLSNAPSLDPAEDRVTLINKEISAETITCEFNQEVRPNMVAADEIIIHTLTENLNDYYEYLIVSTLQSSAALVATTSPKNISEVVWHSNNSAYRNTRRNLDRAAWNPHTRNLDTFVGNSQISTAYSMELPPDEIILTTIGKNFLESAAVFAPYIPVVRFHMGVNVDHNKHDEFRDSDDDATGVPHHKHPRHEPPVIKLTGIDTSAGVSIMNDRGIVLIKLIQE